jgi:hypothetical protein
MSAMSALAREMRSFANARIAAAEELKTFADNLTEEMSEEDFEKQIGAQYGGAGWVAQMQGYIEAAAMSRPGEQWALQKALADALVAGQRADATTKAQEA